MHSLYNVYTIYTGCFVSFAVLVVRLCFVVTSIITCKSIPERLSRELAASFAVFAIPVERRIPEGAGCQGTSSTSKSILAVRESLRSTTNNTNYDGNYAKTTNSGGK